MWKNPENFDEVVKQLKDMPEVVECHYTTGNYDLFIKIYARNNHHLLNIIHDKLQPMGLARSESIISFHAYVFNRQGVKIYEWTDITKGWDGKHNGKDVPDGVYILKIEARGADGKHYNIRQVISLLRGYTYNSAAGTT